MKWLLRAAVGLAAAYIVLLVAVTIVMLQPPDRFGLIMNRLPARLIWSCFPATHIWLWARQGDLAEGGPAPDFTLPTHDRSGEVTLASHRGHRPVVLVFGSYT